MRLLLTNLTNLDKHFKPRNANYDGEVVPALFSAFLLISDVGKVGVG